MRPLLFLALLFLFSLPAQLRAQDAAPAAGPRQDAKSLATVEELTAQVAEQKQKIAELKRNSVNLSREFVLHQQALFACQDQLEAKMQTQKPVVRQEKAKPEHGQ